MLIVIRPNGEKTFFLVLFSLILKPYVSTPIIIIYYIHYLLKIKNRVYLYGTLYSFFALSVILLVISFDYYNFTSKKASTNQLILF